MSEKRETILRLLQDKTGRILDVKIEQEPKTEERNTLAVIELKPETKETFVHNLTEGSVVDWGDGTKSIVTDYLVRGSTVTHTYANTSTTNRVVTIYGYFSNGRGSMIRTPFDPNALVAVRAIGELGRESINLFRNCTSLETVHKGLFDNCTSATDFSSCFQHCTSLTAIPEGLFANCTATTFNACFKGCTSLTAIPEGLFANCTAATGFNGCFWYCTGLTTIPEGLFANCTAAKTFNTCFADCTSLTAIPDGLFANCTAVTDFRSCFSVCSSLTGETPYTMVDGKKVKLWDRSPENGFSAVDGEKCFDGCTGLSDYAEIPVSWK